MVFRRVSSETPSTRSSDASSESPNSPVIPHLSSAASAAIGTALAATIAAAPLAPPLPPPPPPLEMLPPPAPPSTAHSAYQLPPVLVLPHPKVLGLATMDSDWQMVSTDGHPVRSHPVMPLLQAFGQDHTNDAHVTCYTIRTATGLVTEPIPRLTKPLIAGLERMRAEEQERVAAGHLPPERQVFSHIESVVGTMLALDFDLPEHVRWTDAHRTQVEKIIAEASNRWHVLAQPTLFYTTSGGFRLIWALAQPVLVHGAGGLEDLFFGLVAKAHIAGMTVDTACKDWTRLFRLPRVVRADKAAAEAQTWLQPYYAQSWGRIDFNARETAPPGMQALVHDRRAFPALSELSPEEFETNAAARDLKSKWKGRIGVAPRDLQDVFQNLSMGEKPDDGAVQSLLTGGGTQSAAYKQAISRLRALGFPRDVTRAVPEAAHAFKVLVENEDIRVTEGAEKLLHQGIAKLSRALCFCFRDRLGERDIDMTPQFIQALVVQPARKANAARGLDGSGKVRSDAEIDAEVWRLVKWFYQLYRGQAIITAGEAEDDAKERSDYQLRLIAQVGAHQEAITRTFVEWSDANNDAVIKEWIENNWPTMLLIKHRGGRSVVSFSGSGQVCYSLPAEQFGDVLSLGRDCGHELIRWRSVTPDGDEKIRKAEEVYGEYSRVTDGIILSRLVPSSRVRLFRTADGIMTRYVQALPGMRNDIEPKYDAQVDEWLHLLGGADVDELLDWLAVFPNIERPASALYLQGAGGIGKGMLGQALKNLTVSRMVAPFDQVVQEFQDTLTQTPFIWADEKVTTKRMTKALMDSFKKLVSGETDTINLKGEKHVTIEGHWRVFITANHANALPWDEEVSGADLDAVRQRLIHIKAPGDRAIKYLEQIGQRDGTEGWPEFRIPAHVMHLAQTRAINRSRRFLVEAKAKQYHADMQARTSGSDEVLRLLGRLLREPNKYASCVFIKNDYVYFNVANGYEVMSKIVAQDRSRQAFPDSERALTKTIKHISLDENAENHKVTASNMKFGKVLKLWRLDMRFIIDWLDRNEQDSDLRQSLGAIIWKRDAPEHVQAALEALLPSEEPKAKSPPAPPTGGSKPPPAPPSKVLPFPTTGRQSFR
jgi:hypothetical protein